MPARRSWWQLVTPMLALVIAVVGCAGAELPNGAPRAAPTVATPASPQPGTPAQSTAPTAPPHRSPSVRTSASRSMPPPRPTSSTTRTLAPPVRGKDNRAYVLGDSVLLGTTQTLPAALRGWRVTMDCVGSRRLPQAISDLRANRSRIGSVVVIQMGNNYIAGEDGTFAAQIDDAMRVLYGVQRVVWVTVAEKWPSRITINNAIRTAARRWPAIRVADWAPVVAAHPGYAYDMLHLTPSGRLAISRLIAGVVGPAPR